MCQTIFHFSFFIGVVPGERPLFATEGTPSREVLFLLHPFVNNITPNNTKIRNFITEAAAMQIHKTIFVQDRALKVRLR